MLFHSASISLMVFSLYIVEFFKVLYIQAIPSFNSPKKAFTFSGRPFLYHTPINHLVGAEFKWTLYHSWGAGWAAGMRVIAVSSGRSVKTVQL